MLTFQGALAIWESNIGNFAHWERELSVRGSCSSLATNTMHGGTVTERWPSLFWVPPLTPLSDIEKSCVKSITKQRSSRAPLLRGTLSQFNYMYCIALYYSLCCNVFALQSWCMDSFCHVKRQMRRCRIATNIQSNVQEFVLQKSRLTFCFMETRLATG